MKNIVIVAIVLAIFPSVSALNCTLYEGEHHDLCGIIDPLEVSESEKESLMQPSIYGEIEQKNKEIHLELNLSQETLTLDSVYEQNILRAWHIFLFIFVHYTAYSFATRSSAILQWLRVDSLT